MNEQLEPTEDMLLEQVISDGIQYVTSLTKYYGPEKGMEVWKSMGDAMGETIQYKIFMAMLTGKAYDTITFAAGNAPNYGNAVPVIKCIRQYTGVGLKEAKDYWDASNIAAQTIKVGDIKSAQELRLELRKLGCVVY